MYRIIKSSVNLTPEEDDAIAYWKQGNNGWGYADLRAIVNNRIPNSVKNLLEKENITKAEDFKKRLQGLADNIVSAIDKCPSMSGQIIYRVESNYHVPKEGSTIEFEMFTSFAKELTDRLLEDFAIPGGTIYRLIATDSFRDISNVGKSSQDAEDEVLSIKTLKYKVLSVQEETIGGEDTWLGHIGGEKYMMIDLKPMG